MGVAPLEQHVRLGTYHEEGRTQRQHEQPLEINVAAIHNIEGFGFRHDLVQHVDVMHLVIGNANKSWNIAAQVQQGVHLDGSFASPEPGPRRQRKTQIDGCRIQSIQALLQFDAHGLADIQSARGRNQPVGEVGEDTPVARFVGVCQRRACHLATESQVVQLALQRTQTGFDVAQTLAIGQLGEGHRQILIPTGEAAQPQVALITLDAATKLAVGEKADQLREDGAPLIHEPLSALLAFKSRQATNDFNLLGSYYLQPASYNLTGQQWYRSCNRSGQCAPHEIAFRAHAWSQVTDGTLIFAETDYSSALRQSWSRVHVPGPPAFHPARPVICRAGTG